MRLKAVLFDMDGVLFDSMPMPGPKLPDKLVSTSRPKRLTSTKDALEKAPSISWHVAAGDAKPPNKKN